jgi:aminobenzoyl-glutamate utilization protein B
MDKMKKEDLNHYIEEQRNLFIQVSDKLWEFAELGMEEFKSAEYLCNVFNEQGFAIEKDIADMPTAFIASYGRRNPVVAILGEYDALPRLSQKAASSEKEELVKNGNGHGCGHNALGAGSLAACFAVKEYLDKTGKPGTIRFYGCPAEENAAGKTYMVRDGFFCDVDVAFCWHPMDINHVWGFGTQALKSVHFRFKGRSAHAAAAPHLGRSALDAVELMNVGANYLREHIPVDARLHYAIVDAGGTAPNVVQDHAEVNYYVRSSKMNQVNEVYGRLCDVAKGAALMTGTEFEILYPEGISDYIPNKVLGEVMSNNLLETGAPLFDDADKALAEKFRETFSQDDIKNTMADVQTIAGSEAVSFLEGKPICDLVPPYTHLDKNLPGSTDVGDVSYVVPTAQIATACCALGTPSHSWQLTAQMCSPLAHKGLLMAAKVMANSVVDIINSPELAEKAKSELLNETKGVYDCPVPKEMKPVIK